MHRHAYQISGRTPWKHLELLRRAVIKPITFFGKAKWWDGGSYKTDSRVETQWGFIVTLPCVLVFLLFYFCNCLISGVASYCTCLFTGTLSINKMSFACQLISCIYWFVCKDVPSFVVKFCIYKHCWFYHDQKHLSIALRLEWSGWQTHLSYHARVTPLTLYCRISVCSNLELDRDSPRYFPDRVFPVGPFLFGKDLQKFFIPIGVLSLSQHWCRTTPISSMGPPYPSRWNSPADTH